MKQIDEEYNLLLGFSGYSDDIDLEILSLLVDSISDKFKEGMRLTLGNLPHGEKIEQIKVDVNLYTRRQIGDTDIKISREVKVADVDATTDEFKAKYQVDTIEELIDEEEVPEYAGEFIKVESSNIDSIAYDKEEKKLVVKFKQGTVYSYEDCEEEDFRYIINAASAGSAFSEFKKNHTRYSRLK